VIFLFDDRHKTRYTIMAIHIWVLTALDDVP